jgi:hypothetical protein
MITSLFESKYPTQEEIMAEEQKHKKEVLLRVFYWKKEIWKNAKEENMLIRFAAIKTLLEILATIYDKPVNVVFIPESQSFSYNLKTATITVNQTLSVISALHEFAHHVFGPSELKACRWSIWLFKKTFPNAFANLEWNGHLLVKHKAPLTND